MRMALVAVLAGLSGPADPAGEIWLFFSPDSPDATALLDGLRGRRVRPVLVVERFLGKRAPRTEFLSALKRLGTTRVVDPEGLELAGRLGVRELPALAVRHGGSWHLVAGSRAGLEELLSCRR